MKTLKQCHVGNVVLLVAILLMSGVSNAGQPRGRPKPKGFANTADRNNYLQWAVTHGYQVVPSEMLTIYSSGQTQKMNTVSGASVLGNPKSRFQMLQVYENRNPGNDLDLILPERDKEKLEKIYYGIIDPEYKDQMFEEEIWNPETKRHELTNLHGSVLKKSKKIGFFYSIAGDDTLFELGTPKFADAQTHLSGVREGSGYFVAPGFPTGKIPVKIDVDSLTFGRLVFQRDTNYLFYDQRATSVPLRDRIDLRSHGTMNYEATVVTLEDQAAMQGIDAKSRPMIYSFRFFKAGTDPQDGDYFFVASATDASDYFQFPPRLFRANMRKGTLIEYQLNRNDDLHSWSTLFFTLNDLGKDGLGESIPWIGVGESLNSFLGFSPAEYGPVNIAGLMKEDQTSLDWNAWKTIHHLEPLRGEERWAVSTLAQFYLKGTGVFPPDFMSPYYYRFLALREMGLPELNGLQPGLPVLIKENAIKGTGDSSESYKRGAEMGTCLQTLHVLPKRRFF